jgi:hypothetical protein
MDLSQYQCHFKSHVKSSFHSLIPFLPFLLNHLGLLPPELDPILDNNSSVKVKVKVKVEVKVTLRLAVYRQSVCLGVKPPETHDQRFFFSN